MISVDTTDALYAVLNHEWRPGWFRCRHSMHGYDNECAVCIKDVAAILAVAAPIIERQVRQNLAREIEITTRLRCPACHQAPSQAYYHSGRTDFGCEADHHWTAFDTDKTPHAATVAALIRGSAPEEQPNG